MWGSLSSGGKARLPILARSLWGTIWRPEGCSELGSIKGLGDSSWLRHLGIRRASGAWKLSLISSRGQCSDGEGAAA